MCPRWKCPNRPSVCVCLCVLLSWVSSNPPNVAVGCFVPLPGFRLPNQKSFSTVARRIFVFLTAPEPLVCDKDGPLPALWEGRLNLTQVFFLPWHWSPTHSLPCLDDLAYTLIIVLLLKYISARVFCSIASSPPTLQRALVLGVCEVLITHINFLFFCPFTSYIHNVCKCTTYL